MLQQLRFKALGNLSMVVIHLRFHSSLLKMSSHEFTIIIEHHFDINTVLNAISFLIILLVCVAYNSQSSSMYVCVFFFFFY